MTTKQMIIRENHRRIAMALGCVKNAMTVIDELNLCVNIEAADAKYPLSEGQYQLEVALNFYDSFIYSCLERKNQCP